MPDCLPPPSGRGQGHVLVHLERMKLDIGLQLERKESYDCWSQQQTCGSRFCCCRRPMLRQTDRLTDRPTDKGTPYRFIDPATRAGSASNTTQHVSHCSNTAQTNIRDSISPHRPGDGETICPRRWQFDGGKNRGGSTSVRRRLRSPHIGGG